LREFCHIFHLNFLTIVKANENSYFPHCCYQYSYYQYLTLLVTKWIKCGIFLLLQCEIVCLLVTRFTSFPESFLLWIFFTNVLELTHLQKISIAHISFKFFSLNFVCDDLCVIGIPYYHEIKFASILIMTYLSIIHKVRGFKGNSTCFLYSSFRVLKYLFSLCP
jgi:hypothetical protein